MQDTSLDWSLLGPLRQILFKEFSDSTQKGISLETKALMMEKPNNWLGRSDLKLFVLALSVINKLNLTEEQEDIKKNKASFLEELENLMQSKFQIRNERDQELRDKFGKGLDFYN